MNRSFASFLLVSAALILVGCAHRAPELPGGAKAMADHHVHLLGPGALALLQEHAGLPVELNPFGADALIATLDAAGIERGVVAGLGYFFASSMLPVPYEDERVRLQDENDWTIGQAGRYPGRLVAFCGLNPLSIYAVDEVNRCASLPSVVGVKMHFANSGINVLDPAHVSRLREVFAAINERRLALLIHLMVLEPDYGRAHSLAFIRDVMPAAPDVPIQIAHLAGSGPGYDADAAFEVFAEAVARQDPRLANTYFDVASNVLQNESGERLELIARRLRQVGLDRVLFGSDYAGVMNEPPAQAWVAFRLLPLSEDEFRQIAQNVAPYLR